MSQTVTLPLWFYVVLLAAAALAVLEWLLLPGVRWYFRRKMNRVIAEIGVRLNIDIPQFKLTRRSVLIDRLFHDAKVQAAADACSRDESVPKSVVLQRVDRYAREIVPAFNAYLYFRVGYWLAKSVARFLYRVRLGYTDRAALAALNPHSTVVFVMNHRSNMDYVLVAFLAAEKVALSYAVGEWARIWPLQTLFRSMGAYFIRRDSKDPLYRRVLERWVAMATANGVPQAVYPEGGLSKDGALRPPKLGLLDYMLRGFDPKGPRDLVFVPVGVNYDRVLEDRTLLLDRSPAQGKASPADTLSETLRFVWRNARLVIANEWHRFGYACVSFGSPLSTREWLARKGLDLASAPREARFAAVEDLAHDLMARIARVIPVLPVSLVASVLVDAPERAWSELELKSEVLARWRALEAGGAYVHVPRGDQDYAVSVGLRMLMLRHVVLADGGLFRPVPAELPLLTYYANAIAGAPRA